MKSLPLNQILLGNSLEILADLPSHSVDIVFADPPYNLQIQQDLMRPNQTLVDAVDDEWDKFEDFASYDEFTRTWLLQCRRVLKENGTIWVIGSYHNIFRVGTIMMDLGFWVLNDVVWYKTNPMPNFRGTRFTNATETMIWAKRSQEQKKYTFHYHSMKSFNDDKQMPNVWHIPICTGAERLKVNGRKAHSTQKPEALLRRVILASTNRGDIILDPFFGSGTTGAVAKKLGRHFIGIEREPDYVAVARERLENIVPTLFEDNTTDIPNKRLQPRVSFGSLVEIGYLDSGQTIYSKDMRYKATILSDGRISYNNQSGSIHKIAAGINNKDAFNGWDYWYVMGDEGVLLSIDDLREKYRREFMKEVSE